MLWLLHYTEVKVLLCLWLLVVFYAACVTVKLRTNTLLKLIVISIMFIIGYNVIVTSDVMLGTPNFNDRERLGQLNGYSVFQKDGDNWIAILLKTSDGPETFAIPYNSKDEKNLKEGMDKYMKTGVPTIVRRRDGQTETQEADEGKGVHKGQNGEGSRGGKLEFYEFNQNFLQPKGQQLEQP